MTSVAVAFSRFMLRTANTPLSAAWALAYEAAMRAAVAWLRRQHRDASIYLKGSFASREAVYAISDIDLIVVLTGDGTQPGAVQLSARNSWKQLCQKFPILKLVIQHCWFYEEDDLRESLSAPCPTYGLTSNRRETDDRAAFLGPRALCDHAGLQARPSLYGVRREWKRLAGRDRLPTTGPDNAQSRRLAAWLDLQHWWRYAFQACAEPERAHVPLLCVKLIAEPVRLWLWVERGERVASREAALKRGLSELPEEREVLQLGLDLMKALPSFPSPPLPAVIAALLRQTERLAQHMRAAADEAGYVDVGLTGTEEMVVIPAVRHQVDALLARGLSTELMPLADWRARAVPSVPDEAMMLIEANAVDPAFLAATAHAEGGDAIPALHYNSMLLMPTTNPERGMLRAVQCEPTDPVSTALAERRTVARFPELAGWSAWHAARRAVAEHREWLEADRVVYPPHGWVGVQSACDSPTARTLGLLFTAARAALFLESIIEGDPELAVTVAGVAERLVARDSSCRDAVETALRDFRVSRTVEGRDPVTVAPLLEVVRNLPAYAGSTAFASAVR